MLRWIIIGLVLGGAAPVCAQTLAQNICPALRSATDSAEGLGAFQQSTGAVACDTYLAEGAKPAIVCHWQFPFRADAAVAFFETLTGTVTTCLGAKTERKADKPVNHPDSYYLFELNADGMDVSVSLKDKTALGQSLVFLRAGQR